MEYLPRASEFSADRELRDPIEIVRLLRQFPDISRALIDDTTLSFGDGRIREPGDWCLAYLAYLLCGSIALHTWCDRWRSSSLWAECGFATAPSYPTVWLRFRELEDYADAFVDQANKLIRRAKKHAKQIGRYVHRLPGAHEARASLRRPPGVPRADEAPARRQARPAAAEAPPERRHRVGQGRSRPRQRPTGGSG